MRLSWVFWCLILYSTGEAIIWGTTLATVLVGVACGNTANAIDALLERKDDEQVSLQNENKIG